MALTGCGSAGGPGRGPLAKTFARRSLFRKTPTATLVAVSLLGQGQREILAGVFGANSAVSHSPEIGRILAYARGRLTSIHRERP